MKINHLVVAVAMSAGSVLAHADDSRTANAAVVGKVQTVYVEVARGFLVEKKLVGERTPGTVVVEVAMSRDAVVPQVYVRTTPKAAIEDGDLVAVRSGASVGEVRLARDDAQFYETSFVAELKAKHDTLEAMAFMRHPLALSASR